MEKFTIRPPEKNDSGEFLKLVDLSKSIHQPWVSPPSTEIAFKKLLSRNNESNAASFLICETTNKKKIAGVINLNEMVYGALQSAYLGYYAMIDHIGSGAMQSGLAQLIDHAFTSLNLHRLEANIQPENKHSIDLIRRLNFREEGFSPNYLFINEKWRDHCRFALTKEDLHTK